MKKLRIAYDVSFAASYIGKQERITGVGRVIENIARGLAASDEVSLALTGCYGGDPRPALTRARARRYWKNGWPSLGVSFLDPLASRSGLTPRLGRLLLDANLRPDEHLSLPGKLWRKGLNAFSLWDAHVDFPVNDFDIFQSTFNPLPSDHLRNRRPQVLFVFDLVPLDEPGESTAKSTLKEILRSITPDSTWVVCVSEFTRSELARAIYIREDRTAVVPLAAEEMFRPEKDSARFAAVRQSYGLPDAPYFLSVGNPQPRKNIPHLIRCFQQLAREPGRGDIQLVVAGSRKLGWGNETIDSQLAAVPSVRSRIHFVGQVPDADLVTLYSHCHAFVFPSLVEGFALPPMESIRCGAPFIGSNATATSLTHIMGGDGLLVDPLDPRAFTDAMRATLDDPALRASLAASSLKRSSMYSWERTVSMLIDVYREAARLHPAT